MKNTTSKPTEKNNKTEIAKNKPRAISSGINVWCRHDELKDVTELVENPRNPNKHPDKQVALLAKIIRGQGWRQPITISNRSGFIVKGHGRFQAAKVLNVELVPVEYQDYESEAAEYADLMADNRIAELAEPDAGLIDDLLKDVMFEDFDLELTGFTDADLIQEKTEGLTDEDEVPDVPEKAKSKIGQIWKLGNHRLMCGDSTKNEDVKKLCGSVAIDMWITDPPYNVAYEGCTKEKLTIKNDNMSDSSFRDFLREAYKAANDVMKDGAVFYIWHADSEGYNFRGACFDIGWKVRQCLIWVKQTLVMGRQDYHWRHEPCLYGWKDGSAHLWATDRRQTTVLEFNRPSKSAEHPTMKPVELFEYQILNNTNKNDAVLDSFAGSGTTAIAAEKNGRKAFLMELDPKYCDVIIKRWEDFTGQKAELING
jgi:DNA modification methylase